jgi:hypothetical protein
MQVRVLYQDGEPTSLKTSHIDHDQTFKFAVEGNTARLIDVRADQDINKGESTLVLSDLNHAHDEILKLPFIDRVRVWMKGRTETKIEDGEEP